MTDPIYTDKELMHRCELSEDEFGEFRKYGLISPILNNSEGTELYPRHSLEVLRRIKEFRSMGYELEEIRKIVKKVGLPSLTVRKNKKDTTGKYLTVGELAELIGVNARTIKHWEDKGIIYPDARSEGGFRLYREIYVFFGKLILDLQKFGYTLDKIKKISDLFRDFVTISNKPDTYSPDESRRKLGEMREQIDTLSETMHGLKEGITRWEDLLKKKKKEITRLHQKSQPK
jgi:MerR family transcriptional regulator, copper efflux regulator